MNKRELEEIILNRTILKGDSVRAIIKKAKNKIEKEYKENLKNHCERVKKDLEKSDIGHLFDYDSAMKQAKEKYKGLFEVTFKATKYWNAFPEGQKAKVLYKDISRKAKMNLKIYKEYTNQENYYTMKFYNMIKKDIEKRVKKEIKRINY